MKQTARPVAAAAKVATATTAMSKTVASRTASTDANSTGNSVSVLSGKQSAQFLLVCEHASNRIPLEFDNLGLSQAVCESHIAWDPGAGAVTQFLQRQLNAPSVIGGISRLIYDCNRPPESDDAVPERSEKYDIPGNLHLSQQQRADRVQRFYRPFERELEDQLKLHRAVKALVTIHSFTPVYHDQHREVELGILHDSDSLLADALLDLAPHHTSLVVCRNQPYGPQDGVTHTLKRHGLRNGLLNVMIEIRNDLLSTPAACVEIGQLLSRLLVGALEVCAPTQAGGEEGQGAEIGR